MLLQDPLLDKKVSLGAVRDKTVLRCYARGEDTIRLVPWKEKMVVRPERFELPTCCSGGNRSIQLSYGRTRMFPVYRGWEMASTSQTNATVSSVC